MAGRKVATVSLAGQRLDVVVVEVGAVVDRGGAQLDREPHPGPRAELVAVHPQPEAGAAAGLEHRPRLVGVEGAALAEDVDPAAVRRAGRRASSPQTRSTYSSARPSYSGGTTWAPRKVTSSVSSAATSQRRCSVVDVEPVARLDLDVGDARAPSASARRAPGERDAARRSSAARVASVVDADAARLVRRARHARRELLGRGRRRRRGGCGCRRSPG